MTAHPNPCPCDGCSTDTPCAMCGKTPCYFAIVGSAPAHIAVCSVDCGWRYVNPEFDRTQEES